MVSYYDAVLVLIPLAIAGLTATLSIAGLSLTQAVPVASTVAALLIGHAMFVRSPVDREHREPASRPAELSAE